MTLPPGKLLFAAVLLFSAVLSQAARPAEHPSVQAAPSVRPVAHASLTLPVDQRVKPATRKNQRVSQPGWDLSTHGAKALYLTFDDGPHPIYTPQVLSVLARHHALATFFVLGREVAAHPQLVETTRAAGHHIGNHTWDHPMLTHLTEARIRQEISSGVKSRCFRPPYRDTNKVVAAIAASYHFHQILWDVDTNDWKKPGAAAIERAILRGARPGAIILMHDGGGNRTQTVAALDRALTKLSAQGYSFRPLPC
ncbi:peptidoglycan/xylan/chitin deacetylase (PgdA/CDA1 family) [Kribbella voronezhensis]|uniref:Peptidoglycan/xylan/chitin deacetylase (PgdA/CDA1 family) n=1 Tax=Kribbella voronezhensis TaxID=2512212 RepID=A0A4R7T8G9_9ACTN|nr:polysaccharide deacetylase family protein [Kribbella voronezhensis]TDU88222.1 peptidoglycan/xylan/chitin deacetylase (PgdA/CDA1 family) [Kribbella voronezhensis]